MVSTEASKSEIAEIELHPSPKPGAPLALSEKAAKHANDIDAEVAHYAAATEGLNIDPETNKKYFWKINRRILLVMLGTYFCQSLDKGTLGFSSIMGIVDDANLYGQRYSWLGTILYMGVLAGEYPTNYLLQKLPVAKYLAVNVGCWGIVVSCSAATTQWGGLMTVRFLLGLFESCVQPSFIILTTMWYTREEQSLLTSIWYCMTGVQLMVGGLIAYGLSTVKNAALYSWQILFLLLGLLTVCWACFLGWWLPDSPMKAKCFSEEDKRIFIQRIRHNETGIQNRKYKPYQIKETLLDPLIWLYAFLQLTSTLIIGGLGVFSNLIIKSLGFSTLQTQLLNIAQGAITILVMTGSAWLCQRTQQTSLIMFLWSIPPIVGTVILMAIAPTSTNAGGLLIAFYCTQFFLAEGNMIFSLISRNVAGQTKKSLTLALTFIFWAAGNMGAPQIFQSSDAPRYHIGFTVHLCLYCAFLFELFLARLILHVRNKAKREAAKAVHGETVPDDKLISHAMAFQDLTDKENPEFRYVV